MKPVAHLLCGKTGAGKTTHARKLEAEGVVRFTLDEWMIRLYGHHMPREVFDARVNLVMDMILDLSVRLLQLQVPVVLDCGFWTRASRLAARQRLREGGGHTILHYFDVSDSELRARLARRNAAREPGAFEITPEMFDTFSEQFEVPHDDEDDLVVESTAFYGADPVKPSDSSLERAGWPSHGRHCS